MKNFSWLILLFGLLLTSCKEETELATPAPTENLVTTSIQNVTTVDGVNTRMTCTTETLSTGEIYQICKPANWNGELVIYAHGYVVASEPLSLPTEASSYGPLLVSQGYAFATTSYSQNGLAIQTAIQDIIRLREKFIQQYGQPKQIYLTGVSEGGIITTLALERNPQLFSGGMSLCGACGDFQGQLNYYGNFRVLFDYFFKGVLPGNAVSIPDKLIANWQTVYAPAILKAIRQNPKTTLKLLQTAQAPYDPNNLGTIEQTVTAALWFNVFATRDAVKKLGGQPIDNRQTKYSGTGSTWQDNQLNAKVQRFAASSIATETIKKYYETTGNLSKPLVMGHTTQDPIQLFWNLPLYQAKTFFSGKSAYFTGIPVNRYGHCSFTEAEIIQGFSLMLQKIKGQEFQARTISAKPSDPAGKIVQSVRVIQ